MYTCYYYVLYVLYCHSELARSLLVHIPEGYRSMSSESTNRTDRTNLATYAVIMRVPRTVSCMSKQVEQLYKIECERDVE